MGKRLLITIVALLIAAVCGLIVDMQPQSDGAAEVPADALFGDETVQQVYACMDAVSTAGITMVDFQTATWIPGVDI